MCSLRRQVVTLTFVTLVMWIHKGHGQTTVDCDPNCRCSPTNTGLQVDCQNRQLTQIPSTIDEQTKLLLLSSNSITNITRGYFRKLLQLETLYIHRNQISYIQPRSFERLIKLKTLIINSNQLEFIDHSVFSHMPNLNQIDLSNNRITTINRYAFFSLPALSVINLGGNPLNCTCEEKVLANWLNFVGSISIISGQCRNFNSHQLMSLSINNDLPDCINDSVFLSNLKCYTCNGAAGIQDCGNAGVETLCQGTSDVCLQTVTFTSGQLAVSGNCEDYTACMKLERTNVDMCDGSNPNDTVCHFCSPNNLSNARGKISATKTFDIQLSVTLQRQITPGLRDTRSTEYSTFEQTVVSEIAELLINSQGAYIVNFQYIVVPDVTPVVHLQCSTMWFVNQGDVTSAIKQSLTGVQIAGSDVTKIEMVYLASDKCPPQVLEVEGYGVFRWPEASMDNEVYIACPYQLSGVVPRLARRWCTASIDGTAVWEDPDVTSCPSDSELTRYLQSLVNVPITDENVVQVSGNISQLSGDWRNYQATDIDLTVSVIEGILATPTSATDISVIQNTLETANNILNIDTTTLAVGHSASSASTRLISAVDGLLERVDVTNGDFGDVRGNIAGFTTGVTGSDFSGLTLHVDTDGSDPLQESKVRVEKADAVVNEGQSGIVVPKSVFSGLTASQKMAVGKVAMTTYKDANLFSSVTTAEGGKVTERMITTEKNETVNVTREINSHVIGASVPNTVIRNLQDPVIITFKHLKRAVNPECVYWDTTAKAWSNSGCVLTLGGDSSSVCSCDHLTNFALLMDVYATGGGISAANLLALSVISYIGCGISLLAMILTLLTFACFRKLRKDNPAKILMNLCVAIALADLVFLVGMQQYSINSPGACKFVAALLHYFLLAMMGWMLVEAFYMYLALIKIFDTFIPRFQLKSSLFGWGIPLVIVAITLGVNSTDNYRLQPGNICWLSRIPFYVAFLVPICLTIILNSICFVFVMRQIFARSSSKLTKSEKSNTKVRLRGAISVVVLLGLTWVFAIFAVGDFGIVFHYLFAIFNSLQGLFIFIFYCFLKPDVRKAWARTLPCLKSPYEATTTSSNSKGYSETTNNKSTPKTATMESRTSDMSSRSSTLETTVSKTSTQSNTAYRGNWQLNTSA